VKEHGVALRACRGQANCPVLGFSRFFNPARMPLAATQRHRGPIRRDLRRRSAVEPVIGHAKAEHGMRRNFLKGTHGDVANACGRRLQLQKVLAWLATLWRVSVMAAFASASDDDLASPAGA
jgi:hypothetical protein